MRGSWRLYDLFILWKYGYIYRTDNALSEIFPLPTSLARNSIICQRIHERRIVHDPYPLPKSSSFQSILRLSLDLNRVPRGNE